MNCAARNRFVAAAIASAARRGGLQAMTALAAATSARADVGGASGGAVSWSTWSFEPFVGAGLFLGAALYVSGRQWLPPGAKRRSTSWCFLGGWLVLALALMSPLHALGQRLFSAHMIQHELLMVVAAPLLVLGRPGRVWLRAFPRRLARAAVRRGRALGGDALLEALGQPVVATLLHALALWIWHVPRLFVATRTSEWAHAAQHASFLLTAALFWHALVFGRRRQAGYGVAVLCLFFTAMHGGALGALLTLGTSPWYAGSASLARASGLTPLEDQQLGGLIMWVPGGLAYVAAALWLFARWLQDSERRASANEALTLERRARCASSA